MTQVQAKTPETAPADDTRWQAVLQRDAGQDGSFVYGVTSTGVYCRPSCPSRRPARRRVRFYPTPAAAESAGYRACRRCNPRSRARSGERQIEQAVEYLDQHATERVTLERLSRVVGLSPFHLQRTFKRIVGVSPKAYAGARRMELMKSQLRRGNTVSRATYEAGYGSGSRAYEHAQSRLGMTPGAYRKGGHGTHIRYAVVPTDLGHVLAAATERGLCSVALGDDPRQLEAGLRREYPAATIEYDDRDLQTLTEAVLDHINGQGAESVRLDVSGSAFQWQVWEALRRIPPGETRSYQAIAMELGRPTAARAVARACASNRVAVVIPCHRAVRENGEPGGYRWGAERKRRLLDKERAQRDGLRDAAVTIS